jgi:hypothetical protein
MSKYKDFIKSKKLAQTKEEILKGKMPEQGSYVTLFNNDYRILTKPDSKICMLEDSKANKFAYPREKLLSMLTKSVELSNEIEKADGPRVLTGGPNKLVGEIGQNAKTPSGAAPSSAKMKQVDPVGTIRNGRKKVVSKRSGKTMWVTVATGESHDSHEEGSNKHEAGPEAQQQAKQFFESLKDKLHPADKMKLQRQMKELIDIKQKAINMLEMAHQDVRSKAPEAQTTRNKVFALQDSYKQAMDSFKKDLVASASRRKKEGI